MKGLSARRSWRLRGWLVAVLLVACVAPAARASGGDPNAFNIRHQNQQLHIAAAYALAFSTTILCESRQIPRFASVLIGSAVAMAAGSAKEKFMDDHFSPGDEIANGIGTGLSAVFVLTFHI